MSHPGPDIKRLQALFQAGRHDELEAQARVFLARQPRAGRVWYLLAQACLAQGRLPGARQALERASALLPDQPTVWSDLAACQNALGARMEAATSFERSLALDAGRADVWANAGRNALELGRHPDAERYCRRALALQPGMAEAHFNLAHALKAQGRAGEALEAFRRVQALAPAVAEAHSAVALGLLELGQVEAARAACERALELKPGLVDARVNLGGVLGALGRFDEAVAAYQQALALDPDLAEAHSNLGNVLQELGRYEEAVAAYRRALHRKPDFAEAHGNLGNALSELGELDEALAAYRRALELQPGFVAAYHGAANVLRGMGRPDEAVALYQSGLRVVTDDPGMWSGLLFTLNYLETAEPEAMLAAAGAYGERVSGRAVPFLHHGNEPDPDRRLRIGMVSGDFGNHPVGYFLEKVVENLEADSIELFAYETFRRTGELNQRLRRSIPHWCAASPADMPVEGLARRIRADGIDILIDLAGHTAHNRLPVFAWKPAPVQIAWLGYFATTGLAAMDYILADRWVLPPEEEGGFVERPWRLPDSYYCFTPPDTPVDVNSLPSLQNGYITFGCFNKLTKVNERVIACWARILQATPGSRLFLKSKALGNPSVAADYRERFVRHGIESGRLRLEGASPREAYLAAYHAVDIALDPFPFPGGTTSVEGLWMGVPVLTLTGDRFIGHQGETILQSAGLPEWIAENEDDYVAKAAAFASDPEQLAVLRAGLRDQVLASPLFDAPRFARNLEEALRGMWRKWCE
jgi:protein O-GlcNAc transferase